MRRILATIVIATALALAAAATSAAAATQAGGKPMPANVHTPVYPLIGRATLTRIRI